MNRISIFKHVNAQGRGAQHSPYNLCARHIRFLFCDIPYEMRSHKARDRLFGDSTSPTGKKIEALVRLNPKRRNILEANTAIIHLNDLTRILHRNVTD